MHPNVCPCFMINFLSASVWHLKLNKLVMNTKIPMYTSVNQWMLFTRDKIWGGAFSGIPPFIIRMSDWIKIQSCIGESIRREPKGRVFNSKLGQIVKLSCKNMRYKRPLLELKSRTTLWGVLPWLQIIRLGWKWLTVKNTLA